MTGYGLAVIESAEFTVRVEIKALNSRGLDLMVRVPRQHSEKEIALRSELTPKLGRGKVSIWIEVNYVGGDSVKRAYSEELVRAYYRDAERIADELGADKSGLLAVILQYTDVLEQHEEVAGPSEYEWAMVVRALAEALNHFDTYRINEGQVLETEIAQYAMVIRKELATIEGKKSVRLSEIRSSLAEKLQALMDEGRIDAARYEHELIFYAEKLDITEEIVRLGAHLNLFAESLHEQYPGKKLGFVAQEMGREINTIGSKCNDAAIQHHVVIMKEELEKIKEQLLNVL